MTQSIVVVLILLVPLAMSFIQQQQRQQQRQQKSILMASEERKPWEFGRFLKTANFYGALRPRIPVVSGIVKQIRKRGMKQTAFVPSDVLWSVDKGSVAKGAELVWGPLDDVVMGGASRSDLNPGDFFNGAWTGSVTTANNGGFVGKLMYRGV